MSEGEGRAAAMSELTLIFATIYEAIKLLTFDALLLP